VWSWQQCSRKLKEAKTGIGCSLQFLIVEYEAINTAIRGKNPSLWLNLLGSEDPSNRREKWISVEQFQISSQLFDPIDFTASLDLYRYRSAMCITAQQIDRSDSGGVFPADE
jgi:hypothetical protein